MTIDLRKLQANLGVATDGDFGRGSFTALFAKLGAKAPLAAELALSANVHFPAYGIMDNRLRLAHFLAQLAHESGNFIYMEEIASGAAYEGRQDLGNTQPGDGKRYKGRGPIQLTGRDNYREFSRRIGIDLEASPLLAAIPSIGLHIALEYWRKHDLNAPADRDDIERITRRINGGLNGFEDRKRKLTALKALIS